MSDEAQRTGTPLHTKILIGLVVGGVAGVTCNQLAARSVISFSALEWVVDNLTGPLGQIFLNMLFMVVMPIVFCSLSLGVARLGNVGKLGRLGVKTFAYFVLTTTISVSIGLILANAFRPGEGFDRETQQALMERFGGQADQKAMVGGEGDIWPDMLVGIVSRNPLRDAVETKMLPVIFFSVLFGLALTMVPREKAVATLKVLEGVGDAMVVIVGFAMRLAPFAVPALIFGVTALFGWEILQQLSYFVVIVLVAYLIHLFGIYSVLLRVLAHYPPGVFFKKMSVVMVTAFSTSSSAATLPTTIKTSEEELEVPSEVAQVFGVELSVGRQLLVIFLAVVAAVAAAGVPSGVIPLLVVVLETVGVPGEGIAIVIGVDRILDMGRTVLNVTGDATAACFIARSEGYPLKTEK
jgi:DAACS family dicarboxylate/amino acid:cation (Na+ or H+) symporter